MCAERVTRFMSVGMLMFILYLFTQGSQTFALALIVFMAAMTAIWGAFDFCPSIWMMKKIFPSCYCECPKKEENNE
jgi:hypothetical protein